MVEKVLNRIAEALAEYVCDIGEDIEIILPDSIYDQVVGMFEWQKRNVVDGGIYIQLLEEKPTTFLYHGVTNLVVTRRNPYRIKVG